MAWIAGVDGCKGGWIAVYEETDSGKLDCRVGKWFKEVIASHAPLAAVAVDMPIGLCDGKDGRICDKAARRFLGKRSRSIFPAPAAGLLREMEPEQLGKPQFYNSANKLNRQFTSSVNKEDGKGLTQQSWGLVPKIAEVARYLETNLELRSRVHEAHPEVSFTALNAKAPLAHSKTALAGLVARRSLLMGIFGYRFEALEARASEFDPEERASPDDFYDALACLWTARRIHEGSARTLPEDPPGPGGYIFY